MHKFHCASSDRDQTVNFEHCIQVEIETYVNKIKQSDNVGKVQSHKLKSLQSIITSEHIKVTFHFSFKQVIA